MFILPKGYRLTRKNGCVEVEDIRGNIWNVATDICTQEQATATALYMLQTNDEDCWACENCSDCTNCEGCRDCTLCSDCAGISGCNDKIGIQVEV